MYSILLQQREDYEKSMRHANITISLVNMIGKELRCNETMLHMETYTTGKAMYQES